MNPYVILVIAVALIILDRIITPLLKNRKKAYKYAKNPSLLTQNETNFYKALLPIAQKMKLSVCPKVRLADIVTPCKGQNWQAAFNKIQSKHVDFVLCKDQMIPALIIELDDSSHDRPDRQARDAFVDNVFKMVNIPILHTRNTEKLEENIKVKYNNKN